MIPPRTRHPVPPDADARIAELETRVADLLAECDEARRRRDEWRKKAEGFDEIRIALRKKVGAPWPPHLSRALWAGIAADEKKRADDAEARVRELEGALAWSCPLCHGLGYTSDPTLDLDLSVATSCGCEAGEKFRKHVRDGGE